MTGKVRVTCLACTQIDIPAAAMTIESAQNTYRFRCPGCACLMVRQAQPAVIMLLLRAGANVIDYHSRIRGRYDYALKPISEDEQIAFHENLERLPTAER